MDHKTLMLIYYAFFQSIVNYGIIAWGGGYNNCINQIQRIQKRILKIINKNQFLLQRPLTVKQLFYLKAISYYYYVLKNKYIKNTRNTRNKNIQLPKMNKNISKKNSNYVAIKIFNMLSKDLKVMELSKSVIKKRLKHFISENIMVI